MIQSLLPMFVHDVLLDMLHVITSLLEISLGPDVINDVHADLGDCTFHAWY